MRNAARGAAVISFAVLLALLILAGTGTPVKAQGGGIGAPTTPSPTPSPVPEPTPTPTPAPKMAVVVTARDYSRTSYYSGRSRQEVIYFDPQTLRSHIRSKLAAGARHVRMLVDDDRADIVLRVTYTGDSESVRATFVMVDAEGVVLLEETHRINMPFFTSDDMTAAAMKRAFEIADKLVPKFIEALPKP